MEDKQIKILCVDDEDDWLQLIEIFCAGSQYHFHCATNIASAKEHLADHGMEISLLIVDKNLIGEDGLELIRHVKNEYPHIYCVLTSCFLDPFEIKHLANETIRFVNKYPVEIKKLLCNYMAKLKEK